jgi:hypothetical protein
MASYGNSVKERWHDGSHRVGTSTVGEPIITVNGEDRDDCGVEISRETKSSTTSLHHNVTHAYVGP